MGKRREGREGYIHNEVAVPLFRLKGDGERRGEESLSLLLFSAPIRRTCSIRRRKIVVVDVSRS